jgi:hypothetical protein
VAEGLREGGREGGRGGREGGREGGLPSGPRHPDEASYVRDESPEREGAEWQGESGRAEGREGGREGGRAGEREEEAGEGGTKDVPGPGLLPLPGRTRQ